MPLVVGVVLGTLVMLLAGFISSLPFASVTDWFLAATIPLAVLSLPILFYSGLWPNPVLYLIPSQGPLLLLGAAFDQVTLAPWQVTYAVLYPVVCVAGLYWVAKAMFAPLRHRAVRSLVMATSAREAALVAFGRNDIRGTYRDPLLVMIVARPGHLDDRCRASRPAGHRRCFPSATISTSSRTTRWFSPRCCC